MGFIGGQLQPKALLKEEQMIMEMWEKPYNGDLLRDIEDKKLKMDMSVCLESQRLTNFNLDGDEYAFLKRMSIPLLVRAFKESKLFASNPFVVDREAVRFNEVTIEHQFKSPQKSKWYVHSLEIEADYCKTIATQLAHVFDDLIRGANCENKKIVFDSLQVFANVGHYRVNRSQTLVLWYNKI